MPNLYRYSINEGSFGGVVLAGTLDEAAGKVKKKYGNTNKYGEANEIAVWDFLNDDYYDSENKDVVECYGI
jgi:hypothetical protein